MPNQGFPREHAASVLSPGVCSALGSGLALTYRGLCPQSRLSAPRTDHVFLRAGSCVNAFMARPLRVEFAGAFYHVTSRGNARSDIFLDERDRAAFLDVVGRVVKRMYWRCHAYCLMGNHYHLLIETREPNLARGMRHLNGIYTQRFNWRHKRTGHVFQGRYDAILVDRDSYLLELARYIVLNPVRAGFTGNPRRWKWSSYRATAGVVAIPVWLTTAEILGQFGQSVARSRRAYVEFVDQGRNSPSVWERLRQRIFLGSDDFIHCVLRNAAPDERLSEVPRLQRRLVRPLAWYQHRFRNRAAAMLEAYRSGTYTLAQIARHFGVHYSTVSRAVSRQSAVNVR